MLDFVRGKLVEKNIGRAVIETGGIGFSILISSNTASALPQIGESVRLHTYLYVREDQLTLYGFARIDERDLFLTLISISGIGAKGAIKILSGISPETFIEVVASENVDFLTKLPGIGKKSAQRIIVELREKLPSLDKLSQPIGGLEKDRVDEVIKALSALGLNAAESRRALEKTLENIGSGKIKELSTEDIIREALMRGR